MKRIKYARCQGRFERNDSTLMTAGVVVIVTDLGIYLLGTNQQRAILGKLFACYGRELVWMIL